MPPVYPRAVNFSSTGLSIVNTNKTLSSCSFDLTREAFGKGVGGGSARVQNIRTS